MHCNIWTESNRKKRGRDLRTGCGYTMKSFGGLLNNDIAFFIYSIIISYD